MGRAELAKYRVTQSAVSQLLEDVQGERIAIPELQRPFVWDSVKVRDLMDSLYNGYPVGYLITWQSVGAKLKGGQVAAHQQILIDGQQRVTALRAAVAGLPIVTKRYKQKRIVIAFNPVTEEFATWTPAIDRSSEWIPDISELLNTGSTYGFVRQYFGRNPDLDPSQVERSIQKLEAVKNAQIGIIALNDDLDVETVSEIFIRINSKGVPLSSADFAMSKIATYGDRGRNLRKVIDYFCHLAVAPHAYDDIVMNDREFVDSGYLERIEWLRREAEDLYDPQYSDIIRVAGLVGFKRGKVASIVSELSGRDPETRKVDESRIPLAYDTLENALGQVVRKYHFQNFLMIVKSAGFIDSGLIGSRNVLNFAYALYLTLREDPLMTEGERNRIVRRWLVLSLLTGRHSGSFESTWEQDFTRVAQYGAAAYLDRLEQSELSEAFWRVTLPGSLQTSTANSPAFSAFLAAQIASGSRGFLSKSVSVAAMRQHSGDIHHLVPKDYLVRSGITDRRDYNQVANFALTETPINLAIGNEAPAAYMARVRNQIAGGGLDIGEITDPDDLQRNLRENAIPDGFEQVTAETYDGFLISRRKHMAEIVRDYYQQL